MVTLETPQGTVHVVCVGLAENTHGLPLVPLRLPVFVVVKVAVCPQTLFHPKKQKIAMDKNNALLIAPVNVLSSFELE
jgi:hypothetical protein